MGQEMAAVEEGRWRNARPAARAGSSAATSTHNYGVSVLLACFCFENGVLIRPPELNTAVRDSFDPG
jgi:hypothetical protein